MCGITVFELKQIIHLFISVLLILQIIKNRKFKKKNYRGNKYYYKLQNHSFQGLDKGIRHFQRVPQGNAMNIPQNSLFLQPAKFNAIPTPRPMISPSAFLLCALISGVRESAKRP